MKIGIIGAGFTGLAAGYQLQKKGHDVTFFEKDTHPGGLAIGYKEKEWDWTLEQHYHHWFTNDHNILELAKETEYPVIIKRPKTSVFIKNKIYQLDSPIEILRFPKLSLFDRLRMGGIFAILFKFNPWWKLLENIKIHSALPKLIGKKAYTLLWEPQLINKLGGYVKEISLVWFWARIKKRTTSLAYPEKGYLSFARHLEKILAERGAIFHYDRGVNNIHERNDKKIEITVEEGSKKKKHIFDKVIVTLPTHLFVQLTPQLNTQYKQSLAQLKGIGATNMVLRLKKPLLTDKTYWLSICETDLNVMVVVEHTNFMDPSHYNNEHIVYIGNYMPPTDPKFSLPEQQLLKIYDPLLKRLNKNYKENLIDYKVFRAPFAQPIVPANYSKLIPPFETPLKNVFLANMQQVYPWDRGTNYAVELGERVAKLIH